MFSLLNTLVKIGFGTTVCVVGSAAVFTYVTKPTNESFNNFATKDKGVIEKTLLNGILNHVVKPSFDDYVFFKIATLPGGKDMKFIGIVHNWLPLRK